ncbi:hypothetical protein [Clostridium beijerinckii]|uniref:hypothetical protein n=1 Tax=Clostridium beijerinckii TaxID=1520 RepID=UPI00047A205A|nr:hypothetical protein [Clostridium beijerinckii]
METSIKYNKKGQMEYNPEFHAKQHEKWTWEEDLYLMEYYKLDGLIMMSYALEKKESTVYGRVWYLRSLGFEF